MSPFQIIALIIFVTAIALSLAATIIAFLFREEIDAEDPYAEEYPGLYAPREPNND